MRTSPQHKPPHKRGNPKFLQQPGSFKNTRVSQNLPSLSGGVNTPSPNTSLFSYGPNIAGIGRITAQASGPGEPPEGFVGGTTSKSEWYIYWALEKLLGQEGINWTFQASRFGGRRRLGGAVVDFILFFSTLQVGVRIQTYRFHMNVDPRKQSSDTEQLINLSARDTVIIDVFESDYINDTTGQASIKVMLEVINLRQRPNPLAIGNVVGTG